MKGIIYAIRSPTGETIYIGSSQTSRESRWKAWKCMAKQDWLCSPLLRYAHHHWGSLDPCSLAVLAEIELPQDPNAAKTALRHVEDGYIEAAKANDEPLQNTNAPICRCTRTREQQAAWRAANPDYMKTKSREWRQRRKALMAAQGEQ